MDNNIQEKINLIINQLGTKSNVATKRFLIGKKNPLKASLIYIDGLVSNDIINKEILKPLMFNIIDELQEDVKSEDILVYLCEKYIPVSKTFITSDINVATDNIKLGNSAIVFENINAFIIVGTLGGEHRNISQPQNEQSVWGTREGFVENIETNVSIIRRSIKDENLSIEISKIGRRSQTELAILYIDDLVNKDILNSLKKNIDAIDIDYITSTGMLEQYLEKYPYSIFPQFKGSERPDVIVSNLMGGRIALILNGTPYVLVVPSGFMDFFKTVEDYYERTIVANFLRILRFVAVFITLTLPAVYLTLINFNAELIPVAFIAPIVSSRVGIALTPFMEILFLEITVELLREGGLRLPSKIAPTISIVGGIIIGNTAVQSKVVSPSTLLITGLTVIASFAIPNYEMSLTIRFLKFPMLILANLLGILGIAAGWFFIIVHVFSMEIAGVPYFAFIKRDLKDEFIRANLWKMDTRPKMVNGNNDTRQTNFRKKFWGNSNEKK